MVKRGGKWRLFNQEAAKIKPNSLREGVGRQSRVEKRKAVAREMGDTGTKLLASHLSQKIGKRGTERRWVGPLLRREVKLCSVPEERSLPKKTHISQWERG